MGRSSSGFSSYATAEEVSEGIDASNLTAIVTGASSGVGAETARVLVKRGAELDLSSMASVRKFASDFKSMNLPLNILINNAGVMYCPFQLSADGVELQFATNHIGHYLLTKLLLDDMKHTAQTSGIEGRIVIVSSESHRLTYKQGIRFDKINDKSGYSSFSAYGQSKLANVLHARELAKKLQEEGVNITVNSLHPGAIRTELQRHSKLTVVIYHMTSFLWKTVPQGAATQTYLALHPAVKGVSGKYFNNCKESKPGCHANDPEMAKTLWDYSEKIIAEK